VHEGETGKLTSQWHPERLIMVYSVTTMHPSIYVSL
jgi:hypothetical protein